MARPLPPHSDQAHAAITAELQRLSLPHHPSTDRPSLAGRFLDPEDVRKADRSASRRRKRRAA